jgi:hypothetical protein
MHIFNKKLLLTLACAGLDLMFISAACFLLSFSFLVSGIGIVRSFGGGLLGVAAWIGVVGSFFVGFFSILIES